ncbi:MAG: CocE/NonD family hydrolase, partial [Anaerolineae bacterium]|nr:CocE/NonD family hydrolase [Anaerolineae bacterium]
MVVMRDGVKLATDVYRQDSAAPAPVLVTRTPYNKHGILSGFDVIRAVQAGYVVVVQDVRGRYASEGTFNAHFQEIDDGLDMFKWVAEQPW